MGQMSHQRPKLSGFRAEIGSSKEKGQNSLKTRPCPDAEQEESKLIPMSVPNGMWGSQVTDRQRCDVRRTQQLPLKQAVCTHTRWGPLATAWYTEEWEGFLDGILDLMTHEHA